MLARVPSLDKFKQHSDLVNVGCYQSNKDLGGGLDLYVFLEG